MHNRIAIALTLSLIAAGTIVAEDHAPKSGAMDACPMHAQHAKADGSAAHGAEVDARHDTFGMSHAASAHSFRLFADGGAIELRANDANDRATIDAIRTHLQTIVAQFHDGDFSTPAFVHGYKPDGVAAMEHARKDIAYRYEALERGGRIRITTRSAAALAAIHDFLRFQVAEHRTGNSGKVEADR